ncbi:DUF4007 family protein [Flaviaesturariibacter terrae]
MKFQFSGHDSFICKHFWLKKGYDFVQSNGNFNDENSVVKLGVGKNMVTSINYWLKSFGILEENSGGLSKLGKLLMDDNKGYDPYLENLGTIWLLHYYLIKTGKASIYHLFFNEFRKSKFEFTKEQLANFIKRKLEGSDQNTFNANTANSDISVFIRNYLKPNYKASKIDIEDDFSNLMIDLDLMEPYQSENIDGKAVEWYRVESKQRMDLPSQIVLFNILDTASMPPSGELSISFRELQTGENLPGSIFALTEEGLFQKIEQIINDNPGKAIFTETAGVRTLQISNLDKWSVLHAYYKD